jgi:hypothetical protein
MPKCSICKTKEAEHKVGLTYYCEECFKKEHQGSYYGKKEGDSKVSVTVNQDGSSIVSVDTQVPAQCQYCNYARIARGIDECMHPEENGRELEGIGGPPPSWCPLRRGFD